jgi:hypothetical protein
MVSVIVVLPDSGNDPFSATVSWQADDEKPSITTMPPPPGASVRPSGQPTSPWAIVVINRADLPISVEQRLFR